MLQNDLIAEYPGNGELIPIKETIDPEIASSLMRFLRDGDYRYSRLRTVWIVLPGMKSDLEV